jgi:cytoskeletal protein CcmA (bactofilin family)
MFNSTKVDNKKITEELTNSSNNIGKGTILEGNLESYGNIRIEGKLIGNLKSKSKIVLGESAVLEGNILAQNADIAGEVKGLIEVAEVLTLKPSAVINGEILTSKLIVEAGATFNGTCKMGVTVGEIKIGKEPEKSKDPDSSKVFIKEMPRGYKP